MNLGRAWLLFSGWRLVWGLSPLKLFFVGCSLTWSTREKTISGPRCCWIFTSRSCHVPTHKTHSTSSATIFVHTLPAHSQCEHLLQVAIRVRWSRREEFRFSLVSSSIWHNSATREVFMSWGFSVLAWRAGGSGVFPRSDQWNSNFLQMLLRVRCWEWVLLWFTTCCPQGQTVPSPRALRSLTVQRGQQVSATALNGIEWKQFPETHYNWNGKNRG